MNAGLALDRVACVRGGRTLFSGLNLQLGAGQLLRVAGANGAGKTSLLRLMCGLLLPSEGEVRWRGEPLAAQRERWGRELVYLGHAAALKDDLSPLDNLRTASTLGGHDAVRTEALQALVDAGLRGFERTPVRHLSQGQRKRCGLARLVLARHAPLWVLDEPFNALDTAATAWLEGLVRTQLRRGGSVVLTSHQGVALDDVPHQELAL
ncbi:cytochrome c biogenesis heme-transporting ATPase CcmA [Hydrogenophaga sp. IBVHS1]|uniref:cytochrome c biogenesis heme-transporting ATPase CcmA n=1 Tax=unclassified Hydrogenophaga TaxID=2610897 RepID=UPI000A2E9801|nr:cytochrome c biogenesis heme-transporting ATPase CcmA [Hydrogenophaga sp. IBVHS1]OSZ75122.1 heme ABC exporter ATP-binding protein CcmA [Hydrogenophaga sp. IBVHS1]